ncbi:hypothetical protein E4U43_001522 [Claviceps pusilla]|uniref:Required for respiratory growth protein 9, mitochondrial n=1 Tax=Claviceps pusilla TaxID=123648 RepID=A0A9P7NG45_9HYPO|nr:hypothetical protein E4U43_001522 [Claviceps pusilla]
MNCACSAAPWKKFILGLAQVHNVPALVSHSRASAVSTVSRAAGAAPGVATRSSRCFGTGGLRRQEASALGRLEGCDSGETTTTTTAAATTTTTVAEAARAAAAGSFAQCQSTVGDDATGKASVMSAGASSAEQARLKKEKKKEKEMRAGGEGVDSGDGAGGAASRGRGAGLGNGDDNNNNIKGSKNNKSSRSNDQDERGADRPATPRKAHWQIQKEALKEKFPEGWAPRKRLSPDALAGIRALNAQFPDVYTTEALAGKFQVSPEAIRRVLKSKWTPSAEEEQERQERWFRRGKSVWERQAALGIKPPKKWRREGIVRGVEWHERRQRAVQWEREWEENEKNAERERRAREGGGWYGGDGMGGGGR